MKKVLITLAGIVTGIFISKKLQIIKNTSSKPPEISGLSCNITKINGISNITYSQYDRKYTKRVIDVVVSPSGNVVTYITEDWLKLEYFKDVLIAVREIN